MCAIFPLIYFLAVAVCGRYQEETYARDRLDFECETENKSREMLRIKFRGHMRKYISDIFRISTPINWLTNELRKRQKSLNLIHFV